MNFRTLDEIGRECGTDKATLHNYCIYYDQLLYPFRDKPINFLEIGVDGGESIRMWGEYFTHPDSIIWGVDIHDKGGNLGRGKFVLGDATQPNFIYDLVKQTGPFDVVLDDASHYSAQQKDSLRLLWPNLKSGGIWVTEDCSTSYHYPWTLPDEVSMIQSIPQWIDDIMEMGYDQCGKPSRSSIEEIIVRKNLFIMKKRLDSPTGLV